MDYSNNRSRLLASSDMDNLRSISSMLSVDNQPPEHKQLSNYFSNNVFLDREWHVESNYTDDAIEEKSTTGVTWRLKERMKTSGVALVVCLNIGIDPPDIVKPIPCATKECWFDPTGSKQKGLEYIGNALQQQYEKWQAKAKYKQCLDPTSDDLRKVCMNLRKSARNDRLLLHYNGHGVPKPTKNGELWVFGKYYTHYTPVAICELRGWLGDPAIYVLDCSAAGVLISHLVDNLALKASGALGNEKNNFRSTPSPSDSFANPLNLQSSNSSFTMEGPTIVLAACKANEILPLNPLYPADLFTACLTTPITTAIRWFILQNPYSMGDVNPDVAGNVPGKDADRKTPRGELNWIFTAITDTIAWTTLPSKTFQKMFRQDLLVASLFRNYLLAKRIMKSFNCTPQSWPLLPDTTMHHLWQSWDMILESFISSNIAIQKGAILVDTRNNLSGTIASNLSFFTDQLSAFDLWLEFGTSKSEPPEQLPVVLQALLSQTHRLRALQLLKKYLFLGTSAVNLSLMVGIYPYILKLLQSPADDIKQTLIAIWSSIIGFDSTCRQELIREKSQTYFIHSLQSKTLPSYQRCMAAFILAEMCNHNKEGQQTCLHLGLHRICTTTLSQPEVLESSNLKKWICLCLFKLCEDFCWAKFLCITEAGHTQLYPLLSDSEPTVRTAAVLALGELFGASTLTGPGNMGGIGGVSTPGTPSRSGMMSPTLDNRSRQASFTGEERDLREAELNLMWQILDCCMDGSITVRLETIYALTKCILLPAHIDCMKLVAKSVRKRNLEKKNEKSGKRTVSPGLNEAGGTKINYSHPWHLMVNETAEIIAQVEQFIEQSQIANITALSLSRQNSLNISNSNGGVGGFERFSPAFDNFGAGIAAASENPTWLQQQQQQQQPAQGKITPPPPLSTASLGIQQPSPRSAVGNLSDTAWLSTAQPNPSPPIAGSAPNSNDGVSRPICNSPRSEIPLGRKPSDRTSSGGSVGQAAESLPATPSPYSLMASVYVRVWLALAEVQGKDPSNVVVNAAAAIRYKVYSLIAIDEKNSPHIEINRIESASDLAATASASVRSARGVTPPYAQWSGSPFGSPSSRKQQSSSYFHSEENDGVQLSMPSSKKAGSSKGTSSSNSPPVFPLGIANPSDMPPPPMGSFSSKKTPYRGSQPMFTDPEGGGALPSNQSFTDTTAPLLNLGSRSGSFGGLLRRGTSQGSVGGDLTQDVMDNDDGIILCASRSYENAKNIFLRPDPGFAAIDDALSLEGANRAYRNWRIQSITAHQHHIAELFKDVILEDKGELFSSQETFNTITSSSNTTSNKKTKGHPDDSTPTPRTPAVSNLSQSVTKFEEKILLTINNAVMTSLVMFHAFQDIIAISDESSVSIWSLANSCRIMDIKNKHTIIRSSEKDMVKRINTMETSVFTPLAEPRITTMNWINESYNSLLMLGSDDGVVKVWRDTSTSDSIADQLAQVATGRGSGNNSMSISRESHSGKLLTPSHVELATAFAALPDIAETSRGSGMLLSWQQATGTLFAGGNSNTIRIWDLGREQCVRVFDTGTKVCLTALATTVGAFAPNPLSSPHSHHSPEISAVGNLDIPLAWTFAGFADGSIGIYDERVASAGGRVHHARDHTSWIVSAHMRNDAQEVITSSVRGAVKFWDIRSWRTYKTLEVQKSPLTSMTVHNCAPIIATGSHAQFIKILTFGGEQLGNIIKYHDGFLGQRMGPITSLTFHPHRMMLAASAADCIVSIYATADDTNKHSSS